MLERITGKKKRGELPKYSYLQAVPTRSLPLELAQEESGERFGARRMAIEEDLRRRHHDPNADTPHFFLLIAPGGRGVVTIPMPDDGSQCLPVFTSPFRAADYKETLLAT